MSFVLFKHEIIQKAFSPLDESFTTHEFKSLLYNFSRKKKETGFSSSRFPWCQVGERRKVVLSSIIQLNTNVNIFTQLNPLTIYSNVNEKNTSRKVESLWRRRGETIFLFVRTLSSSSSSLHIFLHFHKKLIYSSLENMTSIPNDMRCDSYKNKFDTFRSSRRVKHRTNSWDRGDTARLLNSDCTAISTSSSLIARLLLCV